MSDHGLTYEQLDEYAEILTTAYGQMVRLLDQVEAEVGPLHQELHTILSDATRSLHQLTISNRRAIKELAPDPKVIDLRPRLKH